MARKTIKELCVKYNVNVKGVIQIGAHKGQEVKQFLSLKPKPNKILLIEANPCFAEKLREQYKEESRIKVVSCAIYHLNGQTTLNIAADDGRCSSLLPLKIITELYPDIKKTDEVVVDCKRLDTLLEEMNEIVSDYNYLNMDIQGGEYFALLGASNLLKHIDAIFTEISYSELYDGYVLEPQLTAFLNKNGFVKREEQLLHPVWGDAFYVRA